MDKKRSLRIEKPKVNRASETEEQRKERLRIRHEKNKNHDKQSLATLKIRSEVMTMSWRET